MRGRDGVARDFGVDAAIVNNSKSVSQVAVMESSLVSLEQLALEFDG